MIKIHSVHPLSDLTNRGQGSLTILEESETISGSSHDAITIVSLPIFGVLVMSFLLYKFTNLRLLFPHTLKTKGIFLIIEMMK
ncbi:PIR Superfamily Protein [Plasmodium ovale curtisi]|uniref:PIR Superfamily Protein n=1 Tax=Plasmodium ovale curtisi TaxID=864141 RepID=A0A1A8X938_PLAOA|nr:PIR Superfamily Protein [Plasmodium ovale curtisi]SBT01756.1 PIR Superfamily Protein [Plasmodium ovale curtisi]